jgi:ParB/Sulfiredoxin domain
MHYNVYPLGAGSSESRLLDILLQLLTSQPDMRQPTQRNRKMKMQHVPVNDIVWNPWRDFKVYPIDADHVRDLRHSINQHGFFGGIKARKRNGVYELACGHHRVEAAKKEQLETVPIFVDDIDDDNMIDLMTRENATQGGHSGGAILADVAAVMRRLVAILLDETGHIAPLGAKCFEGKKGFDTARGKLLARVDDPDKDGGLGWPAVMRYLGNGSEEKSSRSKRQIIEAITTLKQSGRYDDIIDSEIANRPVPPKSSERAAKKAQTKEVTKRKPKKQKVFDDRCSALFEHESQSKAFREAVTTSAAQRFIAVSEQYSVAKKILEDVYEEIKGKKKEQVTAPYVKRMVQAYVEQAAKKQREIDKEERDRYMAEQREAELDVQLSNANGSLRSLLSSLARMGDLAREFPKHPKLGGFAERLDTLVDAIRQFSKSLK